MGEQAYSWISHPLPVGASKSRLLRIENYNATVRLLQRESISGKQPLKFSQLMKSKPTKSKKGGDSKAKTQQAPPAESPVKQGGSASMHRILIVDDHPVFRRGLAELIRGHEDLTVCGEAENLPQMMEAARESKPDLVLMDIMMEGTNGIEAIKHLKSEFPSVPVLVVSMHDERAYALRALKAGSLGYLHKGASYDAIITGIRSALDGRIYLDEGVRNEMIYKMVRGEGTASPVDVLSDRELEIFQRIGDGRNVREIADQLHLSVKTVESHCLNMKEKLHFGSRNELVRFATEWVSWQFESDRPGAPSKLPNAG